MNISSDSEVESGLDIESDTTPMAGEGFSVDSHGWKTKVRAVQQRIKELSKGKTKTFSALANSGAEIKIINPATAKRMELALLNTNIG